MSSTKVFWDRFFKLSVLIVTPILGWVYFSEHSGKSLGKSEVIVPFKVEKAPSFEGLLSKLKDGGEVDFSKNQLSVVNFWATWCAPCVEEMPAMSELASRLEEKGVRFYFISIDEDWAKVDRFLEANVIDIPGNRLFLDAKREVASRWGSEKFPETYVVTPQGWKVEKIIGFQDWTRPAIFSYFEKLAEKYKKEIFVQTSFLMKEKESKWQRKVL
jgi:thiol-disulfide isomerase/thioredoxin